MRLYPQQGPVRRVHVEYYDDETEIEVDMYRLPRRWRAKVDDPRFPPCVLDIEIIDGRPAATRMIVEARSNATELAHRDVSSIPTSEFINASMTLVANLSDRDVVMSSFLADPDPREGIYDPHQLVRTWEQDVYIKSRRHARKARQGSRITDEDLREIADTYRAALAAGDPPVRAIIDHRKAIDKPISRSTAGRWVQVARKRGHLGPAPRERVAGEEKP